MDTYYVVRFLSVTCFELSRPPQREVNSFFFISKSTNYFRSSHLLDTKITFTIYFTPVMPLVIAPHPTTGVGNTNNKALFIIPNDHDHLNINIVKSFLSLNLTSPNLIQSSHLSLGFPKTVLHQCCISSNCEVSSAVNAATAQPSFQYSSYV